MQLKPVKWRTVLPPPPVPEDDELSLGDDPAAAAAAELLIKSSTFEKATSQATTAAAGQGPGSEHDDAMNVLKSPSSFRIPPGSDRQGAFGRTSVATSDGGFASLDAPYSKVGLQQYGIPQVEINLTL